MQTRSKRLNRPSAMVLLAAGFAAIPLAASAQPVFDDLENVKVEACGDAGAWVHDAAVFTYFKDSYYDLDVRFRAFSGTAAQRVKTAAAMKDESKRLEGYAFLHEQIMDLIPRLGRLLPRMERAMDLPPMIEQMRNENIWPPRGDHHTEYLRVALARQMLGAPVETAREPGPAIAEFLTYLAAVEEQLLALKSGGEADMQAISDNLQALKNTYDDGFRPVAKRVIFGPYASSLNGRLAFTVKQMCEADLQP